MQGLPISEICRKIEESEAEITNSLLFPGDLVLVYPRIKEQRSRVYRTCDFSGGIITPGSFYISYNPASNNAERGQVLGTMDELKALVEAAE